MRQSVRNWSVLTLILSRRKMAPDIQSSLRRIFPFYSRSQNILTNSPNGKQLPFNRTTTSLSISRTTQSNMSMYVRKWMSDTPRSALKSTTRRTVFAATNIFMDAVDSIPQSQSIYLSTISCTANGIRQDSSNGHPVSAKQPIRGSREQKDLPELMEYRCGQVSTIFCSQLMPLFFHIILYIKSECQKIEVELKHLFLDNCTEYLGNAENLKKGPDISLSLFFNQNTYTFL